MLDKLQNLFTCEVNHATKSGITNKYFALSRKYKYDKKSLCKKILISLFANNKGMTSLCIPVVGQMLYVAKQAGLSTI